MRNTLLNRDVEVLKLLAGLPHDPLPNRTIRESLDFLITKGYVSGLTEQKLTNKGFDFLKDGGHYDGTNL